MFLVVWPLGPTFKKVILFEMGVEFYKLPKCKKQYLKNLAQLNFAVLIISTSGTLGRYIELSVPVIIFLRAYRWFFYIFSVNGKN